MGDLFLGLDCSTQSLTGIIIDFHSKNIIYRNSVEYGKDLSLYKTKEGMIPDDKGQKAHSNPLMWIEALEIFFHRLYKSSIDIKNIKAISGSAQQHGTVYLNHSFENILANLKVDLSLIEQIKGCFSRKTSPIWMDSSTTQQCEEIRQNLGGKKALIILTGSDVFERFSAPQIRKFYQEHPKKYKKTEKIHLVSSFLASILVGQHAPIDHGDGAGMNLMDIKKKQWSQRALNATAPKLKDLLPPLTKSDKIIGNLSKYFVKKYGFSPETKIIAWSGDNPNSLIGIGLIEQGRFGLSLGTSDTFFGYLKHLHLDMKGEGHIFGAPTGDYMSLICYKNGSLARELVKNQYGLSWEEFSSTLKSTPPGNFGKIMLPYFFPEIVPLVLKPKVYRFGFDKNDIQGNVRGIIESQFLSMRLHSKWIAEKPKEIFATGGASTNKEILQVASNIFQIPIRKFQISNSAALGAALRAINSYFNHLDSGISWSELIDNFLDSQLIEIIQPNKNNKELYEDMVELYKIHEDFIVKGTQSPENERKEFIENHFG